MEKLRIIIAAATAELREEAERLLESDRLQIAARLTPDSEGLTKAGVVPAEVLILYSDWLDRKEADFIERLYMTRPHLPCVLLCSEADADMLQRALYCGVKRVIELANANEPPVDALFAAYNREINRLSADTNAPVGYESKVLGIFGTKGGVGKTTVAVNLAVALSKLNKRVVLIDVDLQFGDVGIFLDIAKADTIVDIIEENDYEYAALSSFLFKHSSGLRVLCAPTAPEYAEIVKPEHVEKIITELRSEFDYILLDMPPAFNDISLAALEQCSEIYFLVTPDIPSLRNAQVSFGVIETLNMADKLRLVLNREGNSNLLRRDIEDVLGVKAIITLPCEYKDCTQAVNRGVPIVLGYKRNKISAELFAFAERLISGQANEPPVRGKERRR
ncbi:MAG: AAA family ATPase [Bacillota bacterium]|nr:AAA family ATPase [Bacillota bacterium]